MLEDSSFVTIIMIDSSKNAIVNLAFKHQSLHVTEKRSKLKKAVCVI